MQCIICQHQSTHAAVITLKLERNGAVILVKNVPAQICNNCNEEYLDADTNRQVLALAQQAITRNNQLELEIIRFEPNNLISV